MNESDIQVRLRQESNYRFEVQFDDAGLDVLHTDEPPPLGGGNGPNPVRLLGAAVDNCLTASLLFSLRKFHNMPDPMTTTCTISPERNAAGRWCIRRMKVELQLGVPWSALQHAHRAVAQFEDFCVVTQTVRAGIDVAVRVVDNTGAVMTSGGQ